MKCNHPQTVTSAQKEGGLKIPYSVSKNQFWALMHFFHLLYMNIIDLPLQDKLMTPKRRTHIYSVPSSNSLVLVSDNQKTVGAETLPIKGLQQRLMLCFQNYKDTGILLVGCAVLIRCGGSRTLTTKTNTILDCVFVKTNLF